jgi:hypothetical protein
MTVEEHIERMEVKLRGLAKVQDEMMDVLGLTVEGERRLATRMERSEEWRQEHEQLHQQHEQRMREIDATLLEIGEKLNGLIGIVDGFIRGKG